MDLVDQLAYAFHLGPRGPQEEQTALNIRERAGRRKQKPVRRLCSRSKRVRYLFGIPWVGWSALVA